MTARWLLLAVGGWVAMSASARAQPLLEAPPDRTRLELLAEATTREVRDALARLPQGELLVRIERELPTDAPRPAALVDAVVQPSLDEARRGERHVVHVERGLAAELEPVVRVRRASARGFEAVLLVGLRLGPARLQVSVQAWATGGRGWKGLLAPAPSRLSESAHAIAVDAHLRSFVGKARRLTRDTLVARTAALPGRRYVLLHVADLDDDGRRELLLATDERVEVLRLAGGARGLRLERLAESSLPDLPRASAPARRTVGTAVARDGGVLVRLSDHDRPFAARLDKERLHLSPAQGPCPAQAHPLPDACAERADGRDFFGPTLTAREPATGGTPPEAPGSFYVRRMQHVRRPDGSTQRLEAVVTPGGRLAVRLGSEASGAVGYGAALGLADVDQDGTGELLATTASAPGEQDRVRVLRVRADGGVIALWESEPVQGSIMVAGSGDLDGDGQSELLAIEEPVGDGEPARLWVVQ